MARFVVVQGRPKTGLVGVHALDPAASTKLRAALDSARSSKSVHWFCDASSCASARLTPLQNKSSPQPKRQLGHTGLGVTARFI